MTEELVRDKLASYVDENPDADGPMAELYAMEGSFDEWQDDYTQCGDDEYPGPAECLEMRVLDDAIALNLHDVKVFYCGSNGEPGNVDGVAVTIFVVGITPEGNLAGVKTLAIWT